MTMFSSLDKTAGTLTGSLANGASGITSNFTSDPSSLAGANTFAGFYSGPFTVNDASGTPANSIALIVDSSGNVTRLAVDNIPGHTTDGGVATGTINSSAGAATIGRGTGTLTLSNGVLSGNMVNSGGDTWAVTLNASS